MKKYKREISVGKVKIGGKNSVVVQSMTNTRTENINATIAQIKRLEKAGCEIVRVAVPNEEAACAIRKIKKKIEIPLIADIHFNYKLAIQSIENGADAVRINPGNIGSELRIKDIVNCAKHYNVSMRIGVNGGSLEKDMMLKFGGVTSDALVESALKNIAILEKFGFENLKISIKVSDVLMTIDAYRKLSKITDYPLHVGVTEAGTVLSGSIKSAIGIGILLNEGIGDTLRVSLTGDPVEEVIVAYKILSFLNIRKRGVELISCPTCGRTDINVVGIAESLEKKLSYIEKPLKVAVMGCVVNGPGEAKEADIGIAGGKGVGLIFKKGEVFKKVKEDLLEESLIKEIERMVNEEKILE